jgi:hypothetical protein
MNENRFCFFEVLVDCCGNLKLADFGWSTKIRHADTM